MQNVSLCIENFVKDDKRKEILHFQMQNEKYF